MRSKFHYQVVLLDQACLFFSWNKQLVEKRKARKKREYKKPIVGEEASNDAAQAQVADDSASRDKQESEDYSAIDSFTQLLTVILIK
jgi:hypothetical protein